MDQEILKAMQAALREEFKPIPPKQPEPIDVPQTAKQAMAAALRATANFNIMESPEVESIENVPSHLKEGMPRVADIIDTRLDSSMLSIDEIDQKEAMKDILARFNSALDTSLDNLQENAKTDRDLANALITEETDSGIRIGRWDIFKNDEMDFDVIDNQTKMPIAKHLMLYEAACALATHLNEGRVITDHAVQKILKLEENFAQARQKALHYKHSRQQMLKEGNITKANSINNRLVDAQDKALEERNRLLKLAGLR